MILIFVGIAGLIFSNKIDVIRFINKHNIKWFERQQALNLNNAHQQIDKTAQQPTTLNHSNGINLNSSSNQMVNETNITKRLQITSTITPITTNPPIHNQDVITQHTTAWKSLINKIVSSNKNDIDDMNVIKSVNKQSTVEIINHDTTNFIPPKTTTVPSIQPTNSKFNFIIKPFIYILFFNFFFNMNFISSGGSQSNGTVSFTDVKAIKFNRKDDQQKSLKIEQMNKTNVKSMENIKPYWTYLDPSIVYRAMTSPVRMFIIFDLEKL